MRVTSYYLTLPLHEGIWIFIWSISSYFLRKKNWDKTLLVLLEVVAMNRQNRSHFCTHTHVKQQERFWVWWPEDSHTHTFWFCLISTCLRAMTMREMAWWHKCIHHGKISENWGHMLKHAESNTSIPNLFATWTKVIPTLIFCMLWHCPLVSLRARCINIRAYCTML